MIVKANKKECIKCIYNTKRMQKKKGICRISTNVSFEDWIKGDKYKQCKRNR